jgi:uncharacterized protein (DUF2249 family)
MGRIKIEINDLALKNDLGEFLDVKVHHDNNVYVELDTTHQGKYTIDSLEELDFIYKKLKEILTENDRIRFKK